MLADAGVKASGYPVDHVHGKLQEAFDSFGDPRRRLDLIIGTHYDEDHLVGLVPIIEDTSISIGEAWMPPVANDTQPRRMDRAVGEDDLLVRQFAAEDGAQRLTEYLTAKHAVCQQSAGLERAADRFRSDRPRARRPDLGPDGGPPGGSGRQPVGADLPGPRRGCRDHPGPGGRGPDARGGALRDAGR